MSGLERMSKGRDDVYIQLEDALNLCMPAEEGFPEVNLIVEGEISDEQDMLHDKILRMLEIKQEEELCWDEYEEEKSIRNELRHSAFGESGESVFFPEGIDFFAHKSSYSVAQEEARAWENFEVQQLSIMIKNYGLADTVKLLLAS